MKTGTNYTPTLLEVPVEKDGQSIEEYMRKALHSKEPIEASAKISYSERKDGVLPQFDIRTDRFEYAMIATDRIHASGAAQRHAMDFPEVPKDENGKPIVQGQA